MEVKRLRNGYALSRDGLRILVPDAIKDAAAECLDYAKTILADPDEASRIKCGIETAKTEIDRLASLADRIASGEWDVFDYLPLTKKGRFPENQHVLLADSKCVEAAGYDGYARKRTVRLMLRPYYHTDMDFIHDSAMPDTRVLALDWFDSMDKKVPVFDASGMPRKPEPAARAKYLKDTDVLPGHVYADKSGNRFLNLTGFHFAVEITDAPNSGKSWPGQVETYEYDRPDAPGAEDRSVPHHWCRGGYAYMRWTKKLEKLLDGVGDFNALMHAMSARDGSSPWCHTNAISMRETPRKFVEDAGQVLDASLTRAETFEHLVRHDTGDQYAVRDETLYRYTIYPMKRS